MDEVGRIFGAEDAAESLVESQRAELVALQPVTGSPTAFWFSSGSDTPYSGGDIGAPQLVMETAGLTNIVTGVNATWTPLSWEAVIDADPDVIVLVDAAWNSVDKKIAYLEGNPATAQLTAVREHRYAVIPFPAGEAGVRSVSAAVSLAQQVRELHLP
ncbi:MAG: ABC transporter substrate-binding protein [Schumannella sp.]